MKTQNNRVSFSLSFFLSFLLMLLPVSVSVFFLLSVDRLHPLSFPLFTSSANLLVCLFVYYYLPPILYYLLPSYCILVNRLSRIPSRPSNKRSTHTRFCSRWSEAPKSEDRALLVQAVKAAAAVLLFSPSRKEKEKMYQRISRNHSSDKDKSLLVFLSFKWRISIA